MRMVVVAKEKKLGKISVAKAEGGELLRFCRSASDGALDVATMRFNGRSILLASSLRSSQISLVPPYRCHVHRTICHHARRATVRPRVPSAVLPVELRRSAKTKTTMNLKDLPQGVVKLEAYDEGVDDAPRYPTVVQGHRNNMQKFKNCVILTRVGGFYEVRAIGA